ncbi:MAG: LysE family translocator [Pseudomonadota bacterium]
MIDLAALAIFATALFWNSASPGPSILALVSRAVTRGWRDVLPFVAAMWIGEILWMTCAIAGLAAIAANYQTLFTAIKYAGVLYLLYLAWKMWTSPANLEENGDNGEFIIPEKSRMFFAGLLVTLGNPKIMVFYVALLPTILDLQVLDVSGWIILSATTIIILGAIDLTYIFLAERARKTLQTPSAVKMANRVGAATMGTAAAFIVTR